MKKLATALALAAFTLSGAACDYQEVMETYNPSQLDSGQPTCPPKSKRADKPFSVKPILSCVDDPIYR